MTPNTNGLTQHNDTQTGRSLPKLIKAIQAEYPDWPLNDVRAEARRRYNLMSD